MSITSCSALLAVSSQCLPALCPAASKVQWIAAHLLHSLQCTLLPAGYSSASTIPQAVDSGYSGGGWRDSIAGPTIASGLRANYLHCQLVSQSPLHSAIQPTINICISSILAIIDREKTLFGNQVKIWWNSDYGRERKLFALSVSHWSPLSKLYIVIGLV